MEGYSKEDKKAFLKAFLDRKPVRCSKCKGRLKYIGGGYYECYDCGNQEIDDFGRIRDYIEEYGPSPAIVISEQTEVPIDLVNGMLREGRLEIPEGSDVYIECESCGCSIRFGRYCPDCMKKRTSNLNGVFFNPEMGEKPQNQPRKGDTGKLRFLHF